MERLFHIGMIQMPVNQDTAVNLEYIENSIASLMGGFRKPELIIGVESISSFTPESIPGSITEYLSRLTT